MKCVYYFLFFEIKIFGAYLKCDTWQRIQPIRMPAFVSKSFLKIRQ